MTCGEFHATIGQGISPRERRTTLGALPIRQPPRKSFCRGGRPALGPGHALPWPWRDSRECLHPPRSDAAQRSKPRCALSTCVRISLTIFELCGTSLSTAKGMASRPTTPFDDSGRATHLIKLFFRGTLAAARTKLPRRFETPRPKSLVHRGKNRS